MGSFYLRNHGMSLVRRNHSVVVGVGLDRLGGLELDVV